MTLQTQNIRASQHHGKMSHHFRQLIIDITLGKSVNINGMNANDTLLALKYGADPNQTNDGDTALTIASRNGRAEIVELLLHMEQTSIKPI